MYLFAYLCIYIHTSHGWYIYMHMYICMYINVSINVNMNININMYIHQYDHIYVYRTINTKYIKK